MPTFVYSQALTASQVGYDPLTSWQFRYVPAAWPNGAYCRLLVRATTAGVRLTLFSGSTNIQQRGPVQGGGTAGVTPSPLNTPVIEWRASPGDLILALHDEVLAGTPTVDGVIDVEPL